MYDKSVSSFSCLLYTFLDSLSLSEETKVPSYIMSRVYDDNIEYYGTMVRFTEYISISRDFKKKGNE